jgi:hypothetical protein
MAFVAAILLASAFLVVGGATAPASAATGEAHCQPEEFDGGGQGARCDVTVENFLNLSTGAQSSRVTSLWCSGGHDIAVCTGVPVVVNNAEALTDVVNQCNYVADGGGSLLDCSTTITTIFVPAAEDDGGNDIDAGEQSPDDELAATGVGAQLIAFAAAPPPPPPPPQSPSFATFNGPNKATCPDTSSSVEITWSWSSSNAVNAWFGIGTQNAKLQPFEQVPTTATYTFNYQCSEASQIYTVTLEDSSGRLTHKTVTVTR